MKTAYNKYKFRSGIEVETSSFVLDEGVSEYHLFFSGKGHKGSFKEKVEHILHAFDVLKNKSFLEDDLQPVFCRWFLSDAANQVSYISKDFFGCATSIIEQPPLDGTKVNLWIYCLSGVNILKIGDNLFSVSHGKYNHLWQGDLELDIRNSEESTERHLTDYSKALARNGLTLYDNCVRTWFFVRDVDINYKGVVAGRNKVFSEEGLNPSNHFIASTGIGGISPSKYETVSFNAYAVGGVKREQVSYLKAYSHLNPTIEYGVAFERGTAIDYGDRRHVFISGTASIDNKGCIVHPEDIEGQTHRMWENIEALLKEAETSWDNVAHMIIYLRDLSDYDKVLRMHEERFPGVPKVIVLAPVCRTGWLIEMECMAWKQQECPQFDSF